MLNRTHYPVTTLGPGVRAGIWTQGCSIGCRGCASRDTWEPAPDRLVEVGHVLDWLRSLPRVDGVTITGGEPFEQPQPVGELVDGIRDWSRSLGRDIDVLVYSGFTHGALKRREPAHAVLRRCDAAITGPYVDRLNPGGRWRGSANQRLVILSELGRRRYADAETGAPADERIQICSDGQTVWFVGIPRRGDLDRIAQRLANREIRAENVSWQD
jgi:anaerobic ribonucleoside-triphosphate reductase activating protein